MHISCWWSSYVPPPPLIPFINHSCFHPGSSEKPSGWCHCSSWTSYPKRRLNHLLKSRQSHLEEQTIKFFALPVHGKQSCVVYFHLVLWKNKLGILGAFLIHAHSLCLLSVSHFPQINLSWDLFQFVVLHLLPLGFSWTISIWKLRTFGINRWELLTVAVSIWKYRLHYKIILNKSLWGKRETL